MSSDRPSWWPRLLRLRRYWQMSLRKAWADHLTVQASALAFLTVLSLVPLLAAFSHFGARFFIEQPGTVELLARILPYTEARIEEVLGQFLGSAGSLTGVGFAAFLITAITAFSSIERVINEIWDVAKPRAFGRRLAAFVVVLCAGPILIAGGYSLLYLLEKRELDRVFALPAQALPFLMTFAALTLLNWQVPNTDVRFENALAGGFVSALLIEALRLSFHFFVDNVPDMSVVYGAFGTALLFMISINVAWFVVLLGTEVAYCLQNYGLLSRGHDHVGLRSDWLGLFTMVLVVDRFKKGRPMIEPSWLSGELGLPTLDLRRLIAPLEAAGFLREDDDDEGGWLLARDPHDVAVAEILAVYEEPFPESIRHLPPATAQALQDLRVRLRRARELALGEITLSALVATPKADAAAVAAPIPVDLAKPPQEIAAAPSQDPPPAGEEKS